MFCEPLSTNERFFLFRQIFGRLLLLEYLSALRTPEFPPITKKHGSLTGRQGLTEHVRKRSGSISEKRGLTFGLLCGNHVEFAGFT